MSFISRDLSPLVRGDDWTITLTISSGGSPLDITGYDYYFTLKSDQEAADPGDLQVTASSSGADALAGILRISVPRASTNTLAPLNYYYDIQQQDDSGNVQTLFIGRVKVVRDITRTV